MKRFLAALLFTLLSITPLQSVSSIQPLVWGGHNYCTTFSVNAKTHLWLTAYHCVGDDEGNISTDVYIGVGMKPATVLAAFPDRDLAILQGELFAPTIYLSKTAPEIGDTVTVIGYGNGAEQAWGSVGVVLGLADPVEGYTGRVWTRSATYIARGHSGSPLFNTSGEFIGVLQIGYPESWADSMHANQAGSVQWEELDKLRKKWFPKH